MSGGCVSEPGARRCTHPAARSARTGFGERGGAIAQAKASRLGLGEPRSPDPGLRRREVCPPPGRLRPATWQLGPRQPLLGLA